jgi:hypothetical protein
VTADAKYQPLGMRGIAVLLFGILAGPIAWGLHLVVSYVLVVYVCGDVWEYVLHAVTFGTAAVSLFAGWLAWRYRKRLPEDVDLAEDRRTLRSRFMAQLGIYSGILFFVVIVAEGLPPFFLSTCV